MHPTVCPSFITKYEWLIAQCQILRLEKSFCPRLAVFVFHLEVVILQIDLCPSEMINLKQNKTSLQIFVRCFPHPIQGEPQGKKNYTHIYRDFFKALTTMIKILRSN